MVSKHACNHHQYSLVTCQNRDKFIEAEMPIKGQVRRKVGVKSRTGVGATEPKESIVVEKPGNVRNAI